MSGAPNIAMVAQPHLGRAQRAFVGYEDPPILKANANLPGHTFLLKAKRIGSIWVGSPVFYRDIIVGQVLGWDIADMAEYVTIRAFVRAPYDGYVHDESRFWISEGVLHAESDRGHMEGSQVPGVAFDTPTAMIHTAETSENHVFPLFPNRERAEAASYTRKLPMISYFPGSVRGLAPGSEVTMHGLKIGEVTDVRLSYDAAKDTIVAPVRFEFEPERVIGVGLRIWKTDADMVDTLFKKGLRASLQSAGPNTGQQMVALDFVTDAPPVPVTMEGEDFVLPTAESGGSSEPGTPTTPPVSQPIEGVPPPRAGQ